MNPEELVELEDQLDEIKTLGLFRDPEFWDEVKDTLHMWKHEQPHYQLKCPELIKTCFQFLNDKEKKKLIRIVNNC